MLLKGIKKYTVSSVNAIGLQYLNAGIHDV